MSKERNELRAGIFIVASLVAVLAIIVGIKGLGAFLQPSVERTAVFELTDDLGGLREGDDVRIGGFQVGVVKSIELVEPASEGDTPKIHVVFSMPKKYILREDAVLGIQGTVTGTSWLNFESLGRGNQLTMETPLRGNASPMSRLLASLSAMAPDLKDIASDVKVHTVPKVNTAVDKFGLTADAFTAAGENANGLISDLRKEIPPAMQKYHTVGDRAAEMMTEVRDIAGDTKGDFRETMANLRSVTGTVKDKTPAIVDKVDQFITKVTASVETIDKTLAEVHVAVTNTKDLTAAARSVVAGNRSKLDRMIASLKTTADNLKGASAEIRRSPWRLLYKPSPGEVANLNVFDSARQFSEGASELADATLALRDAMNDPDADEETLQRLMDEVTESFKRFDEIEQKLWQAVKVRE